MYTKIQNLSINILNSDYKLIFNLVIYFVIYFSFYGDKMAVTFCMHENEQQENVTQLTQEEKSTKSSFFHKEILSFLGYVERIQAQEESIAKLTAERDYLTRDNIRLQDTLTVAREGEIDLQEELYDLQRLYEATKIRDFDYEKKFLENKYTTEFNRINQTLEIESKGLAAFQKKCETLEAEARLKKERETIVPSLISNLQETLNLFIEKDQGLTERETSLNVREQHLASDREAFKKEQDDFWERKMRYEQYLREQRKTHPIVRHDETTQTVETAEEVIARYNELLQQRK